MPLISLVGLPGCGKSTIGRRLADRLAVPFLDADREIEREAGASIAELFSAHGEARFRCLEAACIERLTSAPAAIIATGGGAVLSEESRLLLRRRSIVIYLHFRPERLVHRVREDASRPLFQGAEAGAVLRRLYASRDALYRETSHAVVEGHGLSAASLTETVMGHIAKLSARPRSGDEGNLGAAPAPS